MSNQGPQLPSYVRPPSSLKSFEHLNEPEIEEGALKRAAKQKNADKRFNSPFGFHEPKHKKVNFIQRGDINTKSYPFSLVTRISISFSQYLRMFTPYAFSIHGSSAGKELQ